MENASCAAKVAKNGWLGKICLSSFGSSSSSRHSCLTGVPPLFLSLTHLPYVGRNKQPCSAEGWKGSSAFGDLARLPVSHCVNLQSA